MKAINYILCLILAGGAWTASAQGQAAPAAPVANEAPAKVVPPKEKKIDQKSERNSIRKGNDLFNDKKYTEAEIEYRKALGEANEAHARRNRVPEWSLDLSWLKRFLPAP